MYKRKAGTSDRGDASDEDDFLSAGEERDELNVNGGHVNGAVSDGEDPDPRAVVMADFEDIDEAEAGDTLGKLQAVKVTWDPRDVEYWFTELENSMEMINIKSQWVKRVILSNNLPEPIRTEVKDKLKIPKSKLAGADKLIYKVIKGKVIALPSISCL